MLDADGSREALLGESKRAGQDTDVEYGQISHERYHKDAYWPSKGTARKDWFSSWLLAILAYFLGCGTIWVLVSTPHRLALPLSDVVAPYTPSDHVKTFHLEQFDILKKTKYVGYPTDEVDAAWTNLTKPILIRLSSEEMRSAGEDPDTAIKLADGGGGYLGFTSVYHELHCLKIMRWYLYPERYYPKVAKGSDYDEQLRTHVGHCIETFRVLSMCRGDTSVFSNFWQMNEGGGFQQMPRSSSVRKCVDWDSVETWMDERSVTWDPPLEPPEETE